MKPKRQRKMKGAAKVADPDACLKRLTRKNNSIRLSTLKKYGLLKGLAHGPVPPLDDEIDRFLWAYEKRMDVERFTLSLVTGCAFGVGHCI